MFSKTVEMPERASYLKNGSIDLAAFDGYCERLDAILDGVYNGIVRGEVMAAFVGSACGNTYVLANSPKSAGCLQLTCLDRAQEPMSDVQIASIGDMRREFPTCERFNVIMA